MAKLSQNVFPSRKGWLLIIACFAALCGVSLLYPDSFLITFAPVVITLLLGPGLLLWTVANYLGWRRTQRLALWALGGTAILLASFFLEWPLRDFYRYKYPGELIFCIKLWIFAILFLYFKDSVRFFLFGFLLGILGVTLLEFSVFITPPLLWFYSISYVWLIPLVLGLISDAYYFWRRIPLKRAGYPDTSGMDFEPLLARYGGAILRDVPPWEEVGVVPGGADKSQGDILVEIFEKWEKTRRL
jgi:hypothetical protein